MKNVSMTFFEAGYSYLKYHTDVTFIIILFDIRYLRYAMFSIKRNKKNYHIILIHILHLKLEIHSFYQIYLFNICVLIY